MNPPAARPAPRWARIAAHAVPFCVLPSSLWRIGLWLSFVPQMHRVGYWDLGLGCYILGLSVVGESLALLTLGLVRPWGEVVPAWVPVVGGRVLPTRFVVGLAGTGVALLTLLYAYFAVRNLGRHWTPSGVVHGRLHETVPTAGPWLWLFVAAYLPLLAWAPLLAAVTLDYARRRRNSGGGYAGSVTVRGGEWSRLRTWSQGKRAEDRVADLVNQATQTK